ncbi:MAG: GNAT family N-acetyltransferase [Ktedonobacteraceae bacterium]|nr:GNAT family N-acetyltransferase [Ktedonobacteraceae bacterium]
MNTIIDLQAAIEANFAEEMACFGRGLPGATFHQDEELTWFLTGPKGPNGVLLTSFRCTDDAHIYARITETLNIFKSQQVQEIGWRVGPTAYPPDLRNYLQAHGLIHRATMTCMVLETANVQPELIGPIGLAIKEVTDEETLKLKCAVEKRGFGSTESMAQKYYQSYTHSGFGAGTAWHHYIGWLDDKPVAVAALLLHQGVAGIYDVTTIEEARRQGIGETLTRYVVQEARKLNYRVATLSPTDMSEAIYRRIGFRDYCELYHYRLSVKHEN